MAYAFFDTCTRHPDTANAQFVFADKIARVRRNVQLILATAERLDAPVLSLTCLGLQRGDRSMCVASACAAMKASSAAADMRTAPAFVAMDATPADVAEALTHREIVIERRKCSSPEEVVRLRTFDPFINKNTAPIVRALGERHWLVFGAGFEHCLLSTVEGLRALGAPVTVLEDGCIHGGPSTPATFLKSYERIKAVGAGWASFDSVFAEAFAA